MTRKKASEKIIKKIIKKFPKSKAHFRIEDGEDTFIYVNTETYKNQSYQEFIVEISMDFIYKVPMCCVYFLESRNRIVDEVTKEILDMNDETFKKELEKHKNGKFALVFNEMNIIKT